MASPQYVTLNPINDQIIIGNHSLTINGTGSTFWEKGAGGFGSASIPGGSGSIMQDPAISFVDIEGYSTDVTKRFNPCIIAGQFNPSQDFSGGNHNALRVFFQTTPSNAHNVGCAFGAVTGDAEHDGSGTYNLVYGGAFNAGTQDEGGGGGGTILHAYGIAGGSYSNSTRGNIVLAEGGLFYADAYAAGGSITTAIGVHIVGPQALGLVSHFRGLQIDDVTVTSGVNNPDPLAILVLGGNVNLGPHVTSIGTLVESTSHTPLSTNDTGLLGQIAWDANFIYVCTAVNTWKRATLTSW